MESTHSPRLRLLTPEEVCQLLGKGKTALYEMLKKGEIPRPIKLGRENRWRESTLIAWLDRAERKVANAG